MRRTKGFTLIETICSIFIIMMIYAAGLSFAKAERQLIYALEIKKFTYEVQNLLTYSKSICRYRNEEGDIYASASQNKVIFVERDEYKTKSVKCPEHFKIQQDFTSRISEKGKIKKSSTIKIADDNNNTYEISIKTGIDTITIKGDAK